MAVEKPQSAFRDLLRLGRVATRQISADGLEEIAKGIGSASIRDAARMAIAHRMMGQLEKMKGVNTPTNVPQWKGALARLKDRTGEVISRISEGRREPYAVRLQELGISEVPPYGGN